MKKWMLSRTAPAILFDDNSGKVENVWTIEEQTDGSLFVYNITPHISKVGTFNSLEDVIAFVEINLREKVVELIEV